MQDEQMTQDQFQQIMNRLDSMEDKMLTKSDAFQYISQSILTVQAFTFAIIVGCIVVLNSVGAFS